eukprot:6488882-Amphidinium_carterae.1
MSWRLGPFSCSVAAIEATPRLLPSSNYLGGCSEASERAWWCTRATLSYVHLRVPQFSCLAPHEHVFAHLDVRRDLQRSTANRRRPKAQIAPPPLTKAVYAGGAQDAAGQTSPERDEGSVCALLMGVLGWVGGFASWLEGGPTLRWGESAALATLLWSVYGDTCTLLLGGWHPTHMEEKVGFAPIHAVAKHSGRNPTFTEEKVGDQVFHVRFWLVLHLISFVREAFQMADGSMLRVQAGAMYVSSTPENIVIRVLCRHSVPR